MSVMQTNIPQIVRTGLVTHECRISCYWCELRRVDIRRNSAGSILLFSESLVCQ